MPGPAKYNLLTTHGFGMEAPKYTIKKSKRVGKFSMTNEEPGPGQYENTDNSDGKYCVSSLRNTVGNLWGLSKADRFKESSKE